MDPAIRHQFDHGHVIDITTNGRRTGQPRRLEIVFHNFDGRIYISGMPHSRRRSWLANIEADPRVTVHLKGAVTADVPATAREITDPVERRDAAFDPGNARVAERGGELAEFFRHLMVGKGVLRIAARRGRGRAQSRAVAQRQRDRGEALGGKPPAEIGLLDQAQAGQHRADLGVVQSRVAQLGGAEHAARSRLS